MTTERAWTFRLANKSAWRRLGIVLLILGAAPLPLLLAGAGPGSLFNSFVFLALGALLMRFQPSISVELRDGALRFSGPPYMFLLPRISFQDIDFIMRGDLSDVGASMLATRQVDPWPMRTGILVRRKTSGFHPLRRSWMLFRVADEEGFLQAAAAAGVAVRAASRA